MKRIHGRNGNSFGNCGGKKEWHPHAVFLAEDEAALLSIPTITRMWALRGRQPIIPMRCGQRERKTLFGAVNLKTGAVIGQIADTGNATTFQIFLNAVRRRYPRGMVIVILDNVRFHHARAVHRWVARHPRIRFLFLPPYHPKLNPQEMVWQIMRRRVTHNTYYPTFAKEIAAARRFFRYARVEIKNAPASLIIRK